MNAPLEPFGPDVWTTHRPVRFFGLETGTRMTVVRLSDGGLFVHSPIALDEGVREAIAALGEVRAVVAPSLFHHLHVGAWMNAYPKAVFGACPGLEKKRSDLRFSCVLGDTAHPEWARDLEQLYFSQRRENEVVFYLRAQRLLVTADVLLNLSTHPSPVTRLFARIVGNTAPGTGWMEPIMVRDRRIARGEVDRILEWDFDRVALAHGAQVERDGREILRHAYSWL